MAQDVAEDVFGAAEDGGANVLIVVSISIFQRRNPRSSSTPHAALRRYFLRFKITFFKGF